MIISYDKRFVSTGDHENEFVPLFAWKELLGIIDFARLVITLNKIRYYLATLCENSDRSILLRSTDFIIWRTLAKQSERTLRVDLTISLSIV